MSEPDWAGLVAGVGLVLSIFHRRLRRAERIVLIGVCGSAVVITAARAVWVALLVAAVVTAVISSRSRASRKRSLRLGVVLAVFIAAFIGVAVASPTTLGRFSPEHVLNSSGDGGSANSRLGVVRYVLDHVGDRWVAGHGAGTLGYVTQLPDVRAKYAGGGELNGGHGSANFEVTNYFDLGALGALVSVALLFAWLGAAFRAREHVGLAGLAVLLLIDFQFNNGIRLGLAWVILGALAGAAVVATRTAASSEGLPLPQVAAVGMSPVRGFSSVERSSP